VTSLPPDIEKVANDAEATGGANAEDWGMFIARFADYVFGLQRTNMSGLRKAVAESGVVRSMNIVEHFPPLVGAPAYKDIGDDALYWNMTLYLEDGTGGISPENIDKVKKIIDGEIENNIPGYRVPGINIRYMPPTNVEISVKVIAEVDRDFSEELDRSVIRKLVKDVVKAHINNLKIGESFCSSDLLVVLKGLSYLNDVHIVEQIPPPENADGNTGDIHIAPDEIARYADKSCFVGVSLDGGDNVLWEIDDEKSDEPESPGTEEPGEEE